MIRKFTAIEEPTLAAVYLRDHTQGDSARLEHDLGEVIADFDMMLQWVELYRHLRDPECIFLSGMDRMIGFQGKQSKRLLVIWFLVIPSVN